MRYSRPSLLHLRNQTCARLLNWHGCYSEDSLQQTDYTVAVKAYATWRMILSSLKELITKWTNSNVEESAYLAKHPLKRKLDICLIDNSIYYQTCGTCNNITCLHRKAVTTIKSINFYPSAFIINS
jgi:DNA-directed RNA polymerase subunit L